MSNFWFRNLTFQNLFHIQITSVEGYLTRKFLITKNYLGWEKNSYTVKIQYQFAAKIIVLISVWKENLKV